ncbi:MAG: phospholipase D-like domain-containing protein [Phycisphaerae bacterium]
MTRTDIVDILRRTLEDHKLSRSERRALTEIAADMDLDEEQIAYLRNRAFEVAEESVDTHSDRLVLDWLKDVVKAFSKAAGPAAGTVRNEAFFSPGSDCPAVIAQLFRRARRSVDVCVFTITDNSISRAITDAHRRGVSIRIISDDMKSLDLGSDIEQFTNDGLDVVTDSDRAHMHHKFAIFDGGTLLTGSYNWTRGAAEYNRENFIVSDEPRLVKAYQAEFDSLWQEFSR